METVKTFGQPGDWFSKLFKITLHVFIFALNTALDPHENHESAEINIFRTITLGLDDFEMDTPVENSTSISTFYDITTIFKVKILNKILRR